MNKSNKMKCCWQEGIVESLGVLGRLLQIFIRVREKCT
jgi:hypothetical protein